MVSRSRVALVSSCVLGLGYTFYVYAVSPDLVPIHYGPGGVPDRWGTRGKLLTVHWALIGLCTLFSLALPALYRRSTEPRVEATAKLARFTNTVGTAVNLLVIALQLVLSTPRASGRPSALPLLVILAFLLFVLGSCAWLVLSFRERARSE